MVQGILQSLRDGTPISTDEGSWGTPGANGISAVWEPLVSIVPFVSAATVYNLFSGEEGDNLTNMPDKLVPGGERWDLYGLNWFFGNLTGAAPIALQTAWRTFLLSANYVMTLGKITIRDVPLVIAFGNKGVNETYVSTVTAATGGGIVQSWREPWPEEAFLTLQSTVEMKFKIALNAPTDAALAGSYIGAWFDRARAAKMQ